MRLTCPNCGAQYQVADGAIPAAGRDVQCSNCNHVWFEVPGETEDAAPIDVPEDIPERRAPEPQAQPQPEAEAPAPRAMPDPAPTPGPGPAASQPAYDGDGLDAPIEDPLAGVRRTVEQGTRSPADDPAPRSGRPTAPEPAPTPEPGPTAPAPAAPAQPTDTAPTPADPDRPRMTDDIRDILKEEAARETEARRAERPAPAAPDIDVAPPRSAAEAEERETRFPDIDQINSSLRGEDGGGQSSDTLADMSAPDQQSGRTFWRAFWVVFLLVLLALLAYLLAPTIAAAVPALKAPLMGYVTWVDGLRTMVTGMIGG